jgi:ribosome maturation factor RimP
MDGTERIEQIIAPSITAMGYEMVRVMLTGGRRPVLQVMVERNDGAPMTVEDCATISRTISATLDVDDPISGAYSLEVSSPGIDRPLTRLQDFARFSGHQAKIELRELVNGRRRFQGTLCGLAEDRVRIEMPEGVIELPFSGILRAKLVMTDALLAATA